MELLTPEQIAAGLPAGWSGDPRGLGREYAYSDFAEAMLAVNRIAAVAESMDHHPDIDIRWNRVALRIVSHSAGGVTSADLELAARITDVA
jgi:4a-hydroxytetrahydrobiopterin dehydratase